MKIKVNRKVFADALNRVGKCAAKTPVLPYLAHVKIETIDGKIMLTATDLEQRLVFSVDAEVEVHGVTTLPVKKLLSLANSMSGEDMTMETDENHHTTIKSGRTKAKLFGLSADDFPEDIEFAPVSVAKINTPDIIRIVKEGAYAVCPSESRKALQGALFCFSGNEVTVVSTDSKRLAKSSVFNDDLFTEDKQYILPVCGINFLQQLNSDYAELCFSEKHFYCKSGHCFYTCKLIEGSFPNWKMVVPKTFAQTVNLESEQLVSALKTVTVIRGDQPLIQITIDGEKLELKSENHESGIITDSFEIAQGNTHLAGMDTVQIQLNAQFILEALTATGGKGKIQFNYNDNVNPLQFSSGDSFSIIMPIRNNGAK
jgi:DNA polymerase-3 subunit beta